MNVCAQMRVRASANICFAIQVVSGSSHFNAILHTVLNMGRSFLLVSTGVRFIKDDDLKSVFDHMRKQGHKLPNVEDILVDVTGSLHDPDHKRGTSNPPAWRCKDTQLKALPAKHYALWLIWRV